MKSLMVCLMGVLVVVQTGAAQQSAVAGQVRLSGGLPVAEAQVLLFDLRDLRRGVVAQATTDADGLFALPLAALGGAFALPEGFVLGANYPNPFNPATIIPYQLAATAQVRLEVFNTLGQRMAVLMDGEQGAGTYQAQWDATDGVGRAAAAGVYLYRLTVASTGSGDGGMATGRMVLVDGQAGFDRLSPRGDGSSLKAELVDARPVEAAGSAYGLVVLGEGFVAYVDEDFVVEKGMGAVAIEVAEASGVWIEEGQTEVDRLGDVDTNENVPAGKRLGVGGRTIWGYVGDVDNDRQVTFSDALLVMAYSINGAVSMPSGGDISFGDVDGDGRITITDAWLIATYVVNRNDRRLLGLGIGTAVWVVPDDSSGKLIGESRGDGTVEFPLLGGASMEFVWIPPGSFKMGSPSSELGRDSDEGPVHEVKISEGFWLGKYEVTQRQWATVMGSNPSRYIGADRPVENVSWHDVQAFIDKLNPVRETLYRLPTEAEWEYACRAGSSTRWSFGDDESRLEDYAWYGDNNSPLGTKAVGSKWPNAWGVHDMHGNVREWVQDGYGSYGSYRQVDPLGLSTSSYRVIRGGAFNYRLWEMRSADRGRNSPSARDGAIGVRLLRTR